MQTTMPEHMTEAQAEKLGKLRQELFTAKDGDQLTGRMDRRLAKLQRRGEVLVKRERIENIPETLADIGRQIENAHNRGQRRRLKKIAQKLIASL